MESERSEYKGVIKRKFRIFGAAVKMCFYELVKAVLQELALE